MNDSGRNHSGRTKYSKDTKRSHERAWPLPAGNASAFVGRAPKFVMISIHQPHPDKEKLLVDSKNKYGEAARQQKGLVSVHTLKDQSSGELFGIAIWDSQDWYLAARSALRKATQGDDFDSWEKEPARGHRLVSV